MKISAILLMGGSGERFGSEMPEQFHLLACKRVYLHTLERFVDTGLFQEILLVCPEDWLDEVVQETKE